MVIFQHRYLPELYSGRGGFIPVSDREKYGIVP